MTSRTINKSVNIPTSMPMNLRDTWEEFMSYYNGDGVTIDVVREWTTGWLFKRYHAVYRVTITDADKGFAFAKDMDHFATMINDRGAAA